MGGCTDSKPVPEDEGREPEPKSRAAPAPQAPPQPAVAAPPPKKPEAEIGRGGEAGGADSPKGEKPEALPVKAVSKGSGAEKQEVSKKGAKLLDKYVLGKLLGQGAFGVVYKCRRKGTTNDYAVKMVDQVETPLNEIQKEVQMLEVLKHPTVIALHEVFYEKVFVCMVLELYKGGDMIQGMMGYWKRKGMIPMDAVQRLTKQMWESMAFLHSRNYVHRDVKGDNFMMDMPDVENPGQRIYLSDFGTVVELQPGERKTLKCGTKNYWSPEFYKGNYAYKVDCWAVGVIMFGFFSGKFPFKNEQEVNHKKCQIHPRVGEEGEKLLFRAFERDENKRCEAAEAMKHPFVSTGEQERTSEVLDTEFKPEIKEFGADAGVQERRRELVDRLVKNAKKFREDMEGTSPTKAGLRESTRSKEQAASVEYEQLSPDSFAITDKHKERAITFQWTKADDAKNLLGPMEQLRPVKSAGAVNNDVSQQSIMRLLKKHDVNQAAFGIGKAKTLDEFIEEIQKGKARLLIDATRPKAIVRGVDAVLLRIVVNTALGKKFLIERQETYPDGRVRETGVLPGDKRAPHENAIQAAERFVEELLHMQDAEIVFDYGNIERHEQGEESPSYPGIHTVYLKQTVTGVVTVKDEAVLQRIGIGSLDTPSTTEIDVKDSQNYTRRFQWMTEAECIEAGVKLQEVDREDDISALVYPPVGLSEDDLFAYLTDNNVDVSKWGEDTARSVADFSEELVKGESALLRQENEGVRQVVRVVDIVILKLTRILEDGEEQVLREIEEKVQAKASPLDRLPATKRRADEHPFLAARRMISKYLCQDNNMVTLDPDDVKIVQEEQESTSYPGLLSIYRKRYMSAVMSTRAAGQIDTDF